MTAVQAYSLLGRCGGPTDIMRSKAGVPQQDDRFG